jgi:arabinan endo-1,5-alpha-L-arabinosidase
MARLVALIPLVNLLILLLDRPSIAAEPAGTNAARLNNPVKDSSTQFVHDPSTITKCGADYWLFSTGPGISSRHSKDLKNWESGPRVFSTSPTWTTNMVPGFRGYFWAPDIIHLGNRYLLYYSVSRWGVNTSAIGLATNPTLDPADPSFAWTDQGVVCQSRREDSFNAIDPSAMRTGDGSLWLTFGSFWTGIKLIQLDPDTGKRISSASPIYSLAFHSSIEAPCLFERQGNYYLFVNWGQCCKGTNSTYNIRLGRSALVTGPYLDKDGKDLLQGGGTSFLDTNGRFIGPGHAGIYSEAGQSWLSFHYYDGEHGGAATLAVRRLDWAADGWPVLVEQDKNKPTFSN